MASVTARKPFLDDRLTVFVTAVYSAAADVEKSTLTSGLAILLIAVIHVRVPIGLAEIPLVMLAVKLLAGNLAICFGALVSVCWADDTAPAINPQQIVDVAADVMAGAGLADLAMADVATGVVVVPRLNTLHRLSIPYRASKQDRHVVVQALRR